MKLTLIDVQAVEVEAVVDGTRVRVSAADLNRATGWELKPEGVCAGEICVPVPPGATWSAGDSFNLSAFARHIGLAEATDEEQGIAAYEAPRGRRGGPDTVEAPDFTLPDLDGNLHSLSDYRGQKVLLLTWASF